MAKSYVEYTADGSTNQFNLTFSYMEKAHVSVTFDGVAQTFSWVNDSRVQTSDTPVAGVKVRILRTTPTTALTVYQAASTLKGADLTRALTQCLYLSEENAETSDLLETIEADTAICEAAQESVTDNLAAILAHTGAWPYAGPNNFLNLIADTTLVAGIQDGTSSTNLDSYMAAACAIGGEWYLPKGTYHFNTAWPIVPGMVIRGAGMGNTNVISTASWGMSYLAPNGLTEYEGPKVFDLSFSNGAGGFMRLNSPTGGFTDDGTTQGYILRPHVARCDVSCGTIGVSWSKCFDGKIEDCKFTGGTKQVQFDGCDICTIRDNRFLVPSSACVELNAHVPFGSQTCIMHNDMLDPSAGGVFIRSSDLDVQIIYNFIENIANALPCAIDITGGYHINVSHNRVQVANTTNWLKVAEGAAEHAVIVNNHTSGSMPSVLFGTDGSALYYYNSLYRRKIVHNGNTSDGGFPFNSVDYGCAGPRAFKEIVSITPDTYGLANSDYGPSVRCKDGAFVLAPIASYGSLCEFIGETPANGDLAVGIVAYGSVAGQVLNWQTLSNGTPINTSTIALTTSPKFYSLGTLTAATNASVKLWNDDTTHNGNALVRQINISAQ